MTWFLHLIRSTSFRIVTGSLFVLGIALILSLNFWIMPHYTMHGQGVSVPDVTKIHVDDAMARLVESGLRVEIASRRTQASSPPDFVIDQDPSPQKIVKPNRKVYLTINTTSQPKAVVPNVTNMSLRNATIQIENSGLTLGSIQYESNRFRNTVLRQSLTPGDTVAKSSLIDLVVSDGLGDKMVVVPPIAGLLLPEAQQRLRDAGLRVDEIRFQPNRNTLPNTVLSFSPQESSLLEGTGLSLVVSERFDAVEVLESGAMNAQDTLSRQAAPIEQDSLPSRRQQELPQ